MMIYICVICMTKQPPLLFISAEQRQILDTLLSPPLNTMELRARQLLLCACCLNQVESLQVFRQTALKGAQKLLTLYRLIEQNVARTIQVPVQHELVQEYLPPTIEKPADPSDVKVEVLTHKTLPKPLNHQTTPANPESVPDATRAEVEPSQARKKAPVFRKPRTKTRVQCKECSKSLCNTTTLKSHYERAHSESVPSKCDVCDHVCKNRLAMKYHKKYAHRVKEPQTIDNLRIDLFCAECKLQLPSPAAYKTHMLSLKHSTRDQWSFECGSCNRRFPNKLRLAHHIDTVHLKNKHKCDKCEKSYATKAGLRRHVAIFHDRVQLPKKHTCHFCGDSFTSKRPLLDHINTHTGARPHKCKICGDTFGHKSALYLHGRFKHKIQKKNDTNAQGTKIQKKNDTNAQGTKTAAAKTKKKKKDGRVKLLSKKNPTADK